MKSAAPETVVPLEDKKVLINPPAQQAPIKEAQPVAPPPASLPSTPIPLTTSSQLPLAQGQGQGQIQIQTQTQTQIQTQTQGSGMKKREGPEGRRHSNCIE